MSDALLAMSSNTRLLDKLAGLDQPGGDARVKQVVRRVVADLFEMIVDLDVQPSEFWSAMAYIGEVGRVGETGLVAAALGVEHFFDLKADAAERAAGLAGGTPRTIEGPLYIAGAPLSVGEARLDDGTEAGDAFFMDGTVRDEAGQPVAGAIVDVWHANTLGNYSFFDPAQSRFHLRRRIETDGQGRYRFRSIMPSGYGAPPHGPTQGLMDMLGRHARRPAHVHFFVSAPGFRRLTTQINIDGDAYLHDDFAFATRDGLIPPLRREPGAAHGVEGEAVAITFDFALTRERPGLPAAEVVRPHAMAD